MHSLKHKEADQLHSPNTHTEELPFVTPTNPHSPFLLQYRCPPHRAAHRGQPPAAHLCKPSAQAVREVTTPQLCQSCKPRRTLVSQVAFFLSPYCRHRKASVSCNRYALQQAVVRNCSGSICVTKHLCCSPLCPTSSQGCACQILWLFTLAHNSISVLQHEQNLTLT